MANKLGIVGGYSASPFKPYNNVNDKLKMYKN